MRLQIIKRVPEVLRLLHDGAYGGQLDLRKTVEKVWKKFYWHNCKEDVKTGVEIAPFVLSLADSKGVRTIRTIPMRQVRSPFERVAFDVANHISYTV